MTVQRFDLTEGETSALIRLVPFGVGVPLGFGPSGAWLLLDLEQHNDRVVGETLIEYRAIAPRRLPSRLSLTVKVPA